MSTKSREVIWGGRIMGAQMRAKGAREAAQKAKREADRAEAEASRCAFSRWGAAHQREGAMETCIFLVFLLGIAGATFGATTFRGLVMIARGGSYERAEDDGYIRSQHGPYVPPPSWPKE